MRIGFVTIGQSPRDDLVGIFRKQIGERHEFISVGALDGLTSGDIADLAPTNAEEPLVTQVRGGQSVTIAKERILGLMQNRIDELQAEGVDMIVVLCTGPFPELMATTPLLLPDVVLRQFVKGVMPDGSLGIIAPLDEQRTMMHEKWQEFSSRSVEVIDPYGSDHNRDGFETFDTCGLVVLDCMGYSAATRRMVHDHVGKPVILAQDVLAHAVQLLAGD